MKRLTYVDVVRKQEQTGDHAISPLVTVQRRLFEEAQLAEQQVRLQEDAQWRAATESRQHHWDLVERVVLALQQWKTAFCAWRATIPTGYSSFLNGRRDTKESQMEKQLLQELKTALSEWEKFTGLSTKARAICSSCQDDDDACRSCIIGHFQADPEWHPSYYLLDWDIRWVSDRDALELEYSQKRHMEEAHLASIGESKIEAAKDLQVWLEMCDSGYSSDGYDADELRKYSCSQRRRRRSVEKRLAKQSRT